MPIYSHQCLKVMREILLIKNDPKMMRPDILYRSKEEEDYKASLTEHAEKE